MGKKYIHKEATAAFKAKVAEIRKSLKEYIFEKSRGDDFS